MVSILAHANRPLVRAVGAGPLAGGAQISCRNLWTTKRLWWSRYPLQWGRARAGAELLAGRDLGKTLRATYLRVSFSRSLADSRTGIEKRAGGAEPFGQLLWVVFASSR